MTKIQKKGTEHGHLHYVRICPLVSGILEAIRKLHESMLTKTNCTQ